jgi:hypothetical protein
MKLSKEFVKRMVTPSDPEMSFQMCTVGTKWGVYEKAILIGGEELKISQLPFNEDDITFIAVEE